MDERILIVEDEESILLAVSDYLTQLGYQVDCAKEIDAARRLLMEKEYDVVISDIRLTGSDANEGMQLASELATRDGGPEVIMLTAYGSPELESEAKAHGVAAFLHKPKPLGELAQIVHSVLEENKAASDEIVRDAEPKSNVTEFVAAAVPRRHLFDFSDEAMQVARLVSEGRNNREIADSLGIAEQIVSQHREALATRLDSRSRFELALYLVRYGSER
jgi:DNA-binding NarL/FixJ family response regulator